MNDPSSFHGRGTPGPAATPKKTSGKGCLIAVLVVPAVFIILAILFLALTFTRSREAAHAAAEARIELAADSREAVELSEAQLREIPPFTRGGTLSREQLIAHSNDDRATKLSRESFTRDTEGLTVAWSMMTQDISETEQGIRGSFEIPYKIRRGNSTRGSSIQVRAEFPNSARDELITLRRGDWVIIEGKLNYQGEQSPVRPVLTRARIIEPEEGS